MSEANTVNASVVCDCGSLSFYVGIEMTGLDNHIRLLGCTKCGHTMNVPFQQGRKGD